MENCLSSLWRWPGERDTHMAWQPLISKLMGGVPFCNWLFGGKAHFSASLQLLLFVNNAPLWNPQGSILLLVLWGEGALQCPPPATFFRE